MKINVNGKLIDLKIDYRFNKTDINSVISAVKNNVTIRHLTRIKIYQYVLKNIKSNDSRFMCTAINKCFTNKINIKVSSPYDNLLPEFNKKNYRNLINSTYFEDGIAWDWENKKNRIKFLEAIKRQCAVEYLLLRKYE